MDREYPCRACQHPVKTHYCGFCGEYQQHERFTLQRVLSGIPNAILNFERGLLFTIRSLAIKPGVAIRDYLGGVRSKHYRPLNFVFLIGGLYTLLFSFVKIRGKLDAAAYDTAREAFIAEQSLQYQAFLLLLQLPLLSIASWLLFRRQKFYYGEHLIGNAYMVGEITLFQLITFPLYVAFNHSVGVDVLNIVYLLFMAGFGFFTYFDWFFQRRNEPAAVLLSITAVIVNITIVTVSTGPLMMLIYRLKTLIFGE